MKLTFVLCFIAISQSMASATSSENARISLTAETDQSSLATVNAQPGRTLTGKVSDASGAPLPGVSVVVKGTTNGVISDADGNFTISNLPQNATLQFSFVGMKMQEMPIGNQTSLNVILQEDSVNIYEVVAVGYGVKRKSDVAGSVGIATGEDILRTSAFNPLQGLKGKVAGV
ncbi:MAG: carboxypeptidase-like regulatory domain-containing protein, partial [Methanococcaceae archaeon]